MCHSLPAQQCHAVLHLTKNVFAVAEPTLPRGEPPAAAWQGMFLLKAFYLFPTTQHPLPEKYHHAECLWGGYGLSRAIQYRCAEASEAPTALLAQRGGSEPRAGGVSGG